MAEPVGSLRAELSAGHAQFSSDMRKARNAVETNAKGMNTAMGKVKTSFDGNVNSLISFRNKALAAGAALAGIALAAKSFGSAAMRYETLGAVMEAVGKNAGYTGVQMEEFQKRLEKTGISMIQSRNAVIKMTQANLDLEKSTELARVAQDAAVIGNVNSSEAFDRLIHGIQSAQVEVLRMIGINVNFEDSYKRVAKQTGRTTAQLSEIEKAQIRMNAVLDAGSGIAGTYEASMGTAGKQLGSLSRYIEDFKVQMGLAMGPAASRTVEKMTQAVKEMQENIKDPEVQETLESISDNLSKIATTLITKLPGAIDTVTSSLRTVISLWDSLPDFIKGPAGVGIAGSILFGPKIGAILAVSSGVASSTIQLRDDLKGIWAEFKRDADEAGYSVDAFFDNLTKPRGKTPSLFGDSTLGIYGKSKREDAFNGPNWWLNQQLGMDDPLSGITSPPTAKYGPLIANLENLSRAARKAGSAAEDEKAAKEAESRLKRGQDLIISLERERDLIRAVTREEEVRWDLSKGRDKDLAEPHKQRILAIAKELDALDAAVKAEEERKAVLKSIDEEIAALQKEADTYGMSETAIRLYEMSLKGATEGQKESVEVLMRDLEIKKQVAQVMEDIKTPLDEYAEKMRVLNDLLAMGEINQGQYAEAAEKARKAMEAAAKDEKGILDDLKKATMKCRPARDVKPHSSMPWRRGRRSRD